MVMGNKDKDKRNPIETEEQATVTITNEVNETPKVQSMYDNEYVNPSCAKEEKALSDDEIVESPEFNQEEIFEIIINEDIENNINITED